MSTTRTALLLATLLLAIATAGAADRDPVGPAVPAGGPARIVAPVGPGEAEAALRHFERVRQREGDSWRGLQATYEMAVILDRQLADAPRAIEEYSRFLAESESQEETFAEARRIAEQRIEALSEGGAAGPPPAARWGRLVIAVAGILAVTLATIAASLHRPSTSRLRREVAADS